MTRPIETPQPGAPLVGLAAHLAALARLGARDDMPPSGMFGAEGTTTAPPPQCSIGLFQLTSNFAAGPPSPAWTSAPNSKWFCASAARVEYYPSNASPANQWETPSGQEDDDTTAEEIQIWAPAGYQIDSGDDTRTLPAAMQAVSPTPSFYPPACDGCWVWCFYDEGPGCWVVLQPFEDIISIELKTDLAVGGSATAYPMLPDESDANTALTITVYDKPEGTYFGWGRDTLTGGNLGTRGKAKFNYAIQVWEIISLGATRFSAFCQDVSLEGCPQGNFLTEITNQVITAPFPGSYLISYNVSFNGTIPGLVPPAYDAARAFANLYVSHGLAAAENETAGHFHGSANGLWGQLSWTGIMYLQMGDVVSVAVGSLDAPANITQGTLTAVFIGP